MNARRGRLHLKILRLRYWTVAPDEPLGQSPLCGRRRRPALLARTPSDHCFETGMAAPRRAHVRDALLADRRLSEPRPPDHFERLLERQAQRARALRKCQRSEIDPKAARAQERIDPRREACESFAH